MVKRLSNTDQNNNQLTNVPDPISDGDAANKKYVDENISGSDVPYVSDEAPADPEDGMLWYDTDDDTVAPAPPVNNLDPISVSVVGAADLVAKVGTTVNGDYTPTTGDILNVTFSNSNTANNATLNIDGSGAKNIQTGGVNTSNVSLAGTQVLMWYDGTNYQLFGSQRTSDQNTAYTGIAATPINSTANTTIVINRAYLSNSTSKLVFTLPASAAIGSLISVTGVGTGGWEIQAPAGDNIILSDGTDTGDAGSISGEQYTTVYLRCIVANTTWVVDNVEGVITSSTGESSDTRILKKIYPVGSLYYNATDATNPETLLGFGTWTAFAEGRVPVGKATSGTFGTAGATMGAETHTLTVSELPPHKHGLEYGTNTAGAGQRVTVAASNGPNYSGNPIGDTGGGSAHNNIQPSIVVYIWQRTA